MSFNTGNPVPSSDGRDLSDNAATIDTIANSNALSVVTRTGRTASTISNLEKSYTQTAINGGIWAAGQTFTAYNQYMVFGNTAYKLKSSTNTPYVVGATPAGDSNIEVVDTGTQVIARLHPSTLAIWQADGSVQAGDVAVFKERTAGFGGGFTGDVLSGVGTVTGFKIVAHNTLPLSIEVRTNDEFIAEQWGAIGDFNGTAGFDNSPVFQSMIDNMSTFGGTIAVKTAGSYLFGSTITSGLQRSIYIKADAGRFDFLAGGQSGTVEFAVNSAIFIFDFGDIGTTNASGHSFRDFGMKDYSGTALGGIRLRRTSHNRFYDLQTKDFSETGAIAYFIDGAGDAGFLHEFQGCESRNCDKTVKLIEANATRWYGGFIADGEVGIELSDPSDELFFAGSIDNCTVGIDSKSDSLVTSSLARFEVNTTAVQTTRNNNKIDGFFNNNTLDVDIISGTNNVIMGHRAVGSLLVTDNGTDTKLINKEGITVPTLKLTESLFLKRGSGIPQINTDQNDYNPSSASFWALSASVPINITGIAAPEDGRRLTIGNNGSNAITFTNDSGLSVATNRIRTKGAAVLNQNGTVEMYFDTSVSRWIISSVR